MFTRIIILISAFFIAGCGFSDFNSGETHPEVIDISGGWKIIFSDNQDFASPGYDDASWDTITLPGQVSRNKGRQVYWLRKTFNLNESQKNKITVFVPGKIWDVETTYLNGHKIGAAGTPPPDFVSEWNLYRYYYLPDNLMNLNDSNTIAIRVYCNQNPVYNGRPLLTSHDMARKINYMRRLQAEYIPFGISVFMILFSLILAIQFFIYRSSYLFLYFFIISILWALSAQHYFLPTPDFIDYNLRDNLYYTILSLLGFALYVFLEKLLNQSIKYLRIIFLALVIIVSIIFMTATPEDPITGWRFNFFSIWGTLINVSYFIMLARAMYTGNREARVIFAGYLIFMAANTVDLMIISGVLTSPYYYNYLGFPAIILSIGAVLSWRNSITAKELDGYSRNLEKKVNERTGELKNAKEEIEAAYQELEAINQNLTEAKEEIESAYSVINRDMLMASQVQKNFFPKTAPVSDKWDTSYCFRPVSGVSGDVYDFYFHQGRFSGLSLMDVSGHGVSSGLIAMIAKSVVFRSHIDHENESLGAIISKANNYLIEELGNLDNYVTGLFLKFSDGYAEYVNAGHTDLIIKKPGLPAAPFPIDEDQRGFFLGIKSVNTKYYTIKLILEPGDILFVYTDGLTESASASGEQFGESGIMRIINEFSDLPAESIITRITDELNLFTGNNPPVDDITAILMKYTG